MISSLCPIGLKMYLILAVIRKKENLLPNTERESRGKHMTFAKKMKLA
jgi:hypothetical protein